MADFALPITGSPAQTVFYAVLTDGANGINATTGARAALASGSWGNYAIAMTDSGSVGIYGASVPANTPRGIYTPIVYQKSGSPAVGDSIIGILPQIAWDGLKVLTLVSLLGTGDTAVDHNTGGALNLAFQYMGVGIVGAVVRAYLQSDFTAGQYIVRGSTVTVGPDGEWQNPLWLQSSNTYVVTFSAPSTFQESSKVISI